MKRDGRNIQIFLLWAFCQGMVFYSPAAALYRQAAGLDLFTIAALESVCMLTMLALEVPWGWLADRIGYRRTLVVSTGLLLLSKVVFWRAATVWGFLAERVLIGAATSGLSGCDSAYLYTCTTGENAGKIFSRWEGAQNGGLLLAALSWPLLGGDLRRSALWTVGSHVAAMLLVLGLGEPEARQETPETPALCWREVFGRTAGQLGFLVAFLLFDETCQAVTVFYSQTIYRQAGIPTVWLGLLYALCMGAGLSGIWSHRLARRLGTARACGLLMALGSAACVLLAAELGALGAVCGVMLLRGVRAWVNPLALVLQNENAHPAGRAVQLSCNAMVLDLGAAMMEPVLGGLADRSMPLALCAGALCCLTGGVLAVRTAGKEKT